MTTIIISRNKWLRGGDTGLLWDLKIDAGCCLGHFLNQVDKVSLRHMDYVSEPQELEMDSTLCDSGCNTDFAKNCMEINDDFIITDEEREEMLIERFAKEGYTLIFED